MTPPRTSLSSGWWKSPAVRRARRRISDLQVFLYPILGVLVRIWFRLVERFVSYDRRGPLFDFIRQGKPCIVTLWHQDVFPIMFELMRYTRAWPSYFMVSHGRIGRIGTYFLNIWGIECVPVSRRVHGVAAVEELLRRVRARPGSIFLMADGSRGPARKARWGAIHLARDSGLPVVPVHAWGDNLVTLEKTWMRLVLPKPWGRALLLSGEPIVVPAGANGNERLEVHRRELERRLDELANAAEEYFEIGPEAVAAWGAAVSRPL